MIGVLPALIPTSYSTDEPCGAPHVLRLPTCLPACLFTCLLPVQKVLDLSSNKLELLPAELGWLPLRQLGVAGNARLRVPPAVLNRGSTKCDCCWFNRPPKGWLSLGWPACVMCSAMTAKKLSMRFTWVLACERFLSHFTPLLLNPDSCLACLTLPCSRFSLQFPCLPLFRSLLAYLQVVCEQHRLVAEHMNGFLVPQHAQVRMCFCMLAALSTGMIRSYGAWLGRRVQLCPVPLGAVKKQTAAHSEHCSTR
jgi:hypothetical protein